MGKGLHTFIAVVGVLLALELAPVHIGQVQHVAPFPAPSHRLEGAFAHNDALKDAHRLFAGQVKGAETVVAEDGGASLLMIDKYADAWRATATPDNTYQLAEKPFATLGAARPLGVRKDAHGNIFVCNTNMGLVKIDSSDNRVALLASRVSDDSPIDPGSFIQFANSLDIAKDGTIYFSDSHELPITVTQHKGDKPYYDPLPSLMNGLYTGSRTGRLLVYHPHNGTVHVLAKGFWFANGVALSQDESFVTVAASADFAINRFWLKGPKAGSMDILIDRLPGFPDNLNRAADGSFWCALPAPRTFQADLLRSKLLRALLKYASPVQLSPSPWGAIVKISPDGKVLRFLTDTTGRTMFISHVEETRLTNGKTRLFLGSPVTPFVSYIDISP